MKLTKELEKRNLLDNNEVLELPATMDFIPIFEKIVYERLKMRKTEINSK